MTTVKGRCNDTAVESLYTSLDSVRYKRKKKAMIQVKIKGKEGEMHINTEDEDSYDNV